MNSLDNQTNFLISGFNSVSHSPTSSGSKSRSQTYLDNTRITKGNSKPTYITKSKKKRKLSKKLGDYYQTKSRLSRMYGEVGNEKKCRQVFKCCSFVTLKTCGEHISGRSVNYRCYDRLCPECGSKRSNRLYYDYEPIVTEFLLSYGKPLRPVHIVLTQAQRPDETVGEAHKRIKSTCRKLIDRKFWKGSFVGSLNSFEFTVSSRTHSTGAVHFHAHILAFCKLSDTERNKTWLEKFRQDWSAVSKGENKNLKVIPVRDVKNSLREVLKYQVKPQSITNLTTERLLQMDDLRHSRMTSTSGEFHTYVKSYRQELKTVSDSAKTDSQTVQKGLNEGDPCPVCSKPLYSVAMPVKQSIIFIREIEDRLDLSGKSPPT